MGVRLEVQLPAAPVGYVRIQLRRGEVGVSEHLLDTAQIRAALQQMGREGVAEEVRVDAAGLEPGGRCEAAQDEKGARAAGSYRLEQKNYIVKDGDILHVRFSV